MLLGDLLIPTCTQNCETKNRRKTVFQALSNNTQSINDLKITSKEKFKLYS